MGRGARWSEVDIATMKKLLDAGFGPISHVPPDGAPTKEADEEGGGSGERREGKWTLYIDLQLRRAVFNREH